MDEFDNGKLNENSVQDLDKPSCKVQRRILKEAKLCEIAMRKTRDNAEWDETFQTTPVVNVAANRDNPTSLVVCDYFKRVTGEDVNDNLVTKNFAIWCQALQKYLFRKCDVDDSIKHRMGCMPIVVKRKALAPKEGDLSRLVLPGGGDLTSRIWSSIRLHAKWITKWANSRNFDTPAYLDARKVLIDFTELDDELPTTTAYIKAWSLADDQQRLQVKCEILFNIRLFFFF